MTLQPSATDFFVAGGTLPYDSPSYVQRPADTELYEAALAGHFCYVLTPRQMGKSSLMVRTARRLQAAGVRTAVIDLTQIGTEVTVEQWYLGLLTRLKNQLRLNVDPQAWWTANQDVGPVQRFNEFLRDVMLVEVQTPVVIFVDEIDSTLSLDFTDDFFAAIRAAYNARATDPAYERLTFILLGVATPAELIKDRNRTPFNIGHRIDLREFRRRDALVLQQGLRAFLPQQGEVVFDRIFYWTNGHPYFTQKLCLSVIESGANHWNDLKVDRLVHDLFLSEAAKRETNLQYVRENINASAQKRQLLTLYHKVYRGKTVPEDERSLLQNRLKLYGLLQSENGTLAVRNQIYRHAFNEAWIKANVPADWSRRVAVIATLLALLLIVAFAYYLRQQDGREIQVQAQQAIDTFENNTNPELRLNSLNQLLNLEGYHGRARDLFHSLSREEQLALFSPATYGLTEQRVTVTKGIYVGLDNTAGNKKLLEALQKILAEAEGADSLLLSYEIEEWLAGREAYAQGDSETAIDEYSNAINSNNTNPALYFDRALAHIAETNYTDALTDFDQALVLSTDTDIRAFWQTRIQDTMNGNAQLYATAWQQRSSYSALTTAIPTPTIPSTTLPE